MAESSRLYPANPERRFKLLRNIFYIFCQYRRGMDRFFQFSVEDSLNDDGARDRAHGCNGDHGHG
jgi:hypothetical protein